jgi:hypothetical protein
MGKLIGPLCGLVDPGCDAEPLATAGPMIESAPSIDASQLDFEAWHVHQICLRLLATKAGLAPGFSAGV